MTEEVEDVKGMTDEELLTHLWGVPRRASYRDEAAQRGLVRLVDEGYGGWDFTRKGELARLEGMGAGGYRVVGPSKGSQGGLKGQAGPVREGEADFRLVWAVREVSTGTIWGGGDLVPEESRADAERAVRVYRDARRRILEGGATGDRILNEWRGYDWEVVVRPMHEWTRDEEACHDDRTRPKEVQNGTG